jgi:hypothetical protein
MDGACDGGGIALGAAFRVGAGRLFTESGFFGWLPGLDAETSSGWSGIGWPGKEPSTIDTFPSKA